MLNVDSASDMLSRIQEVQLKLDVENIDQQFIDFLEQWSFPDLSGKKFSIVLHYSGYNTILASENYTLQLEDKFFDDINALPYPIEIRFIKY